MLNPLEQHRRYASPTSLTWPAGNQLNHSEASRSIAIRFVLQKLFLYKLLGNHTKLKADIVFKYKAVRIIHNKKLCSQEPVSIHLGNSKLVRKNSV